MLARTALALLLGLVACSETSESSNDAATNDTADASIVDCSPGLAGVGGQRLCPAGCVGFSARRVDGENDCVTGDEIVVACFPETASVMGDGSNQCFRDATDPSVMVRSPSDTVRVSGGSDDLLVDQGWVRCDRSLVVDCAP